MVKQLLSSVLLSVLCLAASAQTFAPKMFSGLKLDKQTVAVSKMKKAPAKAKAKAALAANQRLIGYYTTDDASEYGLGLSYYCTGTIKPGVLLEKDLNYAKYIGTKVVGVRFYLPEGTATGVEIFDASDEENMQLLASKDETITSTGWNTVMLDEKSQFTLTDKILELMVTTKLIQTETNWPIGINSKVSGCRMYVYANIPESSGGGGEGWYDFGEYALAIQLIVESDNFPQNAVTPADFGKFTVGLGKTKEISVTLYNEGSSLKNFSYTITQNGETSEEKTITLDTPLGVGGNTTAVIPFPAASKQGRFPVTLTITKVNGVANELTNNTAKGTNVTLAQSMKKVSVVEELSGVTCGWCPRGHVGMSVLRAKYGDQFIGVALHGYSYDTSEDAMYNPYLPDLGFTGAPACIINRNGEEIDPYYGSDYVTKDGICNDFAASLEEPTEVGVTTRGFWNADSTEVTVKADYESLVNGTYKTAYYLVADSLHGTTDAWMQRNYYYSEIFSRRGWTRDSLEQTYPDLVFLWDKGKTYEANYNDVAIASSYRDSINLASDVLLTEGQTTAGTYTMTMPTSEEMKKAINKELVYVVALVIDAETGEIVNAAKGKIFSSDPTGINNITPDTTGSSEVVARYTANGKQITAPVKGLNILKLANGKTVKVMVK